jgi:transposase
MKEKGYTNSFKLKVALEATKGDRTIAELISQYKVSKTTIGAWKKELLEKGEQIFGTSVANQEEAHSKEIEKLHRIIGQLKVENDFLVDASNRLLGKRRG